MPSQKFTGDLASAIETFLKELPDPKNCNLSTVKSDFFINGKKVTLQAQKSKGFLGMTWNIEVRKN